MRLDVNVSLRPKGDTGLNTKVPTGASRTVMLYVPPFRLLCMSKFAGICAGLSFLYCALLRLCFGGESAGLNYRIGRSKGGSSSSIFRFFSGVLEGELRALQENSSGDGRGRNRRRASTSIGQSARSEPLQSAILARCGRCLLYTSPSPRDATLSRMPSSA